ncbi:hypothetical protein [Bradyrhizobium sp. CCBAU 45394]|uniref:hypothetical protein n=1 Tax=Bradyrhizobium sp. CCBAU 45394 TaxID=1325087 RepID=UPI0023030568|nr:hypothetical protein [Bradyrhizobium sp. CCBAU 45394]
MTVGEFGQEHVVCRSDPIEDDQTSNAAHAIADYSVHPSSRQKNIAKRLKLKAIARGCLHPPQEEALNAPTENSATA